MTWASKCVLSFAGPKNTGDGRDTDLDISIPGPPKNAPRMAQYPKTESMEQRVWAV